jgi:Na+/melibiose symporter-like transporter
LVEIVGYVIAELLAYAFVRVFLCVALAACIGLVICWFVPHRELRPSIVGVAVAVGFVGGIGWEVLGARKADTHDDRT